MFPPDAELWIDWHLTNRCNFYCSYCHPQIRYVLNRRDLSEPSPQQCSDAFDALEAVCGILMSGGEPFAFPDFIRLCELLCRKHYIAINTNLSMTDELVSFIERIPVERVGRILSAVHAEERASRGIELQSFAQNYLLLRRAGYDIEAAYVLHPNVLDRAPDDFRRLRELGVDRLVGKVFKGIWNKRKFPTQYNVEELSVVRELISGYKVGVAYLAQDWDFRGLPCWSGVRSFKVNIKGEVNRCVSVQGSLGNIYNRTFEPFADPQACSAKHVRVLSECAEHLVELPASLQAALDVSTR